MSRQAAKLSPQEEEDESNGTAMLVVTAFQGKDRPQQVTGTGFQYF